MCWVTDSIFGLAPPTRDSSGHPTGGSAPVRPNSTTPLQPPKSTVTEASDGCRDERIPVLSIAVTLQQMKVRRVCLSMEETARRAAWAALNGRSACLPHVKVKHTIHPELESIYTPDRRSGADDDARCRDLHHVTAAPAHSYR